MKTFLLISLILITSIAKSQNSVNVSNSFTPKWQSNSPGYELQKASNHYFTGVILTGAGIVTSSLSLVSIDNTNENKIYLYTGVALALIGSIFMIESKIHIGRAGFLMDKNGVGIKLNL